MPTIIMKTRQIDNRYQEVRFDLSSVVMYSKLADEDSKNEAVELHFITGDSFQFPSKDYEETTWKMFTYALEEYFGGYISKGNSGVIYGEGAKPDPIAWIDGEPITKSEPDQIKDSLRKALENYIKVFLIENELPPNSAEFLYQYENEVDEILENFVHEIDWGIVLEEFKRTNDPSQAIVYMYGEPVS